jgi:hypothetical protein
MSEFLKFLNSADEETLLTIEGMPKALAKRLVDSRPIKSNEDCLKIKGMSVKLFSTLQSGYLEHKEEKIEEAVEQLEAAETEEEPKKKKPRVWVQVLRWILIVLIILGAVYAAVIYGVPYIYKTFLAPVESNTARLSEVAADNQTLSDKLTALTNRVSTLEARADAVDVSISGLTASIDNLTALSASLDAEVAYKLDLARAINYLSRARLYLSQSNNGLARADVVSARNLLSAISPAAPVEQVYALNEAINNLDKALSNLPAYPVVAVYYIDISWQYLVDDLSATAPTVVPPTEAPTEVTTVPPAETVVVTEAPTEVTPAP